MKNLALPPEEHRSLFSGSFGLDGNIRSAAIFRLIGSDQACPLNDVQLQ